MPTDPNAPTLWDKLTGYRHADIALPNQSGSSDPRLTDPAELIKSLANNSSLQALKQFGLSAVNSAKKK